jgi:predicted NAD/FAD-dependent oxidoreductase
VSPASAGPLPGGLRVAVVGAGISGLACAAALQARGARVVVFEASRRPGGRAATETTPAGAFDSGTQYFTAQAADFGHLVDRWCSEGLVEPWDAQVIAIEGDRTTDKTGSARRFIVRDGMQALGRRLARGLDLRLDVTVGAITRRGTSWQVFDVEGATLGPGGYDVVVLAIPQPAELLASPALAQRARRVVWHACWAALVAIEPRSGFEFGGAFINDHPVLAWVTREDAKRSAHPGGGERWVLHATPRWSALHLNHAADDVASMLADAFARRFNFGFRPTFIAARRWPNAAPANALKEPFLWDPALRIGAVGDWCGGPRLEGAFRSGQRLGERIQA